MAFKISRVLKNTKENAKPKEEYIPIIFLKIP